MRQNEGKPFSDSRSHRAARADKEGRPPFHDAKGDEEGQESDH